MRTNSVYWQPKWHWLPFFLFTLPAGALADRQKLVCTVNVCLAATALALALLGWLHLLNPYLILGGVFFIGVGFAINAPAWTSIVCQVVSHAELPSAATLGSLQFSISGIIGPAGGCADSSKPGNFGAPGRLHCDVAFEECPPSRIE